MWSLACVCAEMYLGLPLFPGVSQHNQLTRIIEMMGYPPDSLIEGKNGSKYFSRVSLYPTGNGSSTYSSQSDKSHSPKELWGLPTQSQISQKYHLKTAEEYALETSTEIPILRKYLRYSKLDDVIMKCPLANKSRMSSEQKREEMLRRLCFLNFLEGLFKMNPFERWTAKQAANHPFITNAPFTGQFTPAVDPKINERKLAYFVQTQRRDNTVRGGSHLQGNAGSSLEGSSDGMHVFRPLQFRRLSEPLRISPADVKEVRFEEYKNQGQGPSLQRGQSVRELDDQSATSQSQIRYQHQSLPYNSSQYMQQQQYLQRQLAHQQQYVDLQLIQQPEQYSAYSASTTEGVWASYTIKEQVAISSSNSHYMESLTTPGSQSTSTMVRNSSSCDDLPSSAMMNGKGRSLMTGDSRDNSWSYNFNSNGRDSGEGGVNIPNSPGQQQLQQQQHQLQQQSRSYMQNDTSTNLSYTKRSNLNQPRNDYRNNNHNNRMSPHQYQASNSQPLQQPHSNDQTKGHRGQQLQQQQVNSVRQQYPINQQQSQHQTQLRNSTQYNYSGPQTDTYNSGNRQVSGSMDSTSGSGFEGFGGSMTDVPLMMTDFGQALMRPELDERRRLHSMQPSGGQMQHDQHFNCDMPKGQMWMNQQQSQSFTRQRPSQLPYYPPQQVQHQQHLHQQLNQQSQHLNQNQTDSRNHKQQQQRMSSSQDKHDSRHLNDINLKELVRSKLPYNASSSDTVASSSAMSALSDRILAAGGGGRGDDHTDQGRSVSFAESKDSDTHNYVAQLVVTSRGSSGFLSGTNSPNQLEGHRNRVGSSGGGGERSSSGRNSNSNSNSDINTSDRKSPLKDVASRSISSDASNKTQGGVGDVTDALGDWDPFFGGDDFEMEEELDGRGEKKILPHSISATTSGSRSGSAAMSDRCSTDDGDIDPDVDESEWRSAGSRGNSADVNPTPELPYRKLV